MHLVDWITNYLVKNEIIDSETSEWFTYGVLHRLSTLSAILLLYPIASYLSSWTTALGFLLSFFFLRKRTNGYHAKSFLRCLVFSVLSVIIIFLLILPHLTNNWILGSTIVSGVVIFLLSPYRHPNINMTKEEIKASAFLAKRNMTALFVVVLCTQGQPLQSISIGVSLGISYTAFLLVLAYLQNQEGGSIKNERKEAEILDEKSCEQHHPE